MTNIEMRLDDLDAKLDNIQRLIVTVGAGRRSKAGKAPQPSKKKTMKAKPAKRGKK
jgi:hypothetical protein